MGVSECCGIDDLQYVAFAHRRHGAHNVLIPQKGRLPGNASVERVREEMKE
jgi:hypothetical protein